MNRSVRSRVTLMLALVSTWLAGCPGDRPAPSAPRVVAGSPLAADSSPVGAAAAPVATTGEDRPTVQVMPDGSLELRPRITDVSMLERQPDGSYRRRCGKPSDQTRTMMEQAMRAR